MNEKGTQNKSTALPNYVRKETLEATHQDAKPHESLKAFRHSVSRLDQILTKLNTGAQLDKASIMEAALNNILQKKGFGGKNAGMENRAYFRMEAWELLLVINTVADGKPNSSISDIDSLLLEIDAAIPNVENIHTSPAKPKLTEAQKLDQRIMNYEVQIQKLNADYRENSNDLFRAMDGVVEMFKGESGRKIYEGAIQNVQKQVLEDYLKIFRLMESGPLTPEELKLYTSQKKKLANLLEKKLEMPELFVEHLMDNKMQSLYYWWEGVKGMSAGAFEAVFGTVILLYSVCAHPEVREALKDSGGKAGKYIWENATEPKKVWDDFSKMLKSEMEKIKNLPPEQQANLIGKITGNIIATLLGAKAAKSLLHSDALRIKYVSNVTDAVGDAAKVAKPAKRIKMGQAKNWAELDDAIEQIERVRFREGWGPDKIKSVVADVRNGRAKLSALPEAWGLRDKVGALIKHGGEIPEDVGLKKIVNKATNKVGEKTGELAKKAGKSFAEKFPGLTEELEKFSSLTMKNVRTGHDFLDIKISHFRTNAEHLLETIKSGAGEIGQKNINKLLMLVSEIRKDSKPLEFAWKKELLESLARIDEFLSAWYEGVVLTKNKSVEGLKTIREKAFPNMSLTQAEIKGLKFEGGLAVEEVRLGKERFFRYRTVDGRLAFDKKFKFKEAWNFVDGQATVRSIDTGKLGIIDKKGELLLPAEYDALHSLSSEVKIGKVGNKFHILKGSEELDRSGNKFMVWRPTESFDLVTNPREGMSVGIKKTPKGEARYLINEKGEVTEKLGQTFNTGKTSHGFVYIDDFNDQGVAAAMKKTKDGKETWHIIDRDGKEIGSIREKSNLEALQKFETINSKQYDEVVKISQKRAEKILAREGVEGALEPTPVEGMFFVTDKYGKKGVVNIHTKDIIQPKYDYIQVIDSQYGFMRVKQDGKWGVVEMDGQIRLGAKYDAINICDDRLHLLEVEMDGKVGLLTKEWVERIPIKYSYISSPSDGVYRGEILNDAMQVVEIGKNEYFIKEIASSSATAGDMVGTIMTGTGFINSGRKLEKRGVEVIKNGTDELSIALENTDIFGVMTGFTGLENRITVGLSKFLEKLPHVKDIDQLALEVEKYIAQEVDTFVKNYLTRNNKKLSVKEAHKVVEFKEAMNEEFFDALIKKVEKENRSEIVRVSNVDIMDKIVSRLNDRIFIELGGKLNTKKSVRRFY